MPAYKNKKRHTWYCSFYFTDWQGRRKKKKKEGFPTKRSALDWERKFLELYSGSPDIRFATLVAAYKKHHQDNTRIVTHYTKTSMITNHILPYFSSFPISQISKHQILAWKKMLTDKNFQPLYIRQIYCQLKSIFSFAMEHYQLPANPCAQREHFGRPRKRINYWTINEFRQFVMTLTKPHHIMAFYMLFWTGMRSGELLALTWADIDFTCNSISINKSFTRLHLQDILTSGKTNSSQRIVIMPAFLADMLKDYQKLLPTPQGRIFPFTRNMLHFTLKKGIKKAKLKEIRLHDLRHSHASLLINAGFRPIDVADRLGHSNPGITLSIYSHFYDSKRTSLAEKLNNIY
ncbi:site-specific integrase [Selenomonas sp. AE3005]|uniref:tyrosine-type recombinase/integrase n=1 Tax=Selenomonas sp. AE3005 TaxID=1485543 RepID=UPI0025D4BB19|nr:site-specific integrase [Selenomonas sp. AE3005]